MDLQSATKLSGRNWQLTRIGALVFFALTCGLLASSLLNASRAGVAQEDAPRWATH